ncbi:MAG: DsbA family protein [Patescibacteria group bacterium]
MNKRSVVSVIIFVAVAGGISLFVWRTLSFYQKIENGTLQPDDLSFMGEFTKSSFASAVANQSVETVYVDSKDDPAIGPDDAVLTIVEFADFSCPYSKEVSSTVRRLVESYGDRVRYVYRDFPLVDVHPEAERAAEAGACAHDQRQFWAYHDKLFQNQDDLSESALARYAMQVGLDVEEFEECMQEQLFVDEVADDMADGLEAGVVGTPTFFFNGTKIEGAIPEYIFESLIESFLEEEPI